VDRTSPLKDVGERRLFHISVEFFWKFPNAMSKNVALQEIMEIFRGVQNSSYNTSKKRSRGRKKMEIQRNRRGRENTS
jgi:hypothetical protein